MRRGNIQAEVLAIRTQLEDCLKRLDKIQEMSAEPNSEDEEEKTSETIPPPWRKTTLGVGRSAEFKFTMSFGATFIETKKLEKASFFETKFDDKNHRIYFNFHNDDPGVETCRLDSRTDKGKPTNSKRTENIRPQESYTWLTKLKGSETKDRQFVINANDDNKDETSAYTSFPYYVEVKQA